MHTKLVKGSICAVIKLLNLQLSPILSLIKSLNIKHQILHKLLLVKHLMFYLCFFVLIADSQVYKVYTNYMTVE